MWMLLSCAWKQSGVSIKKSSSLTYHLKMYQWPTISNWFWNKWANKTSKEIWQSTLIWWLSLYISKWGSKKATLCLLWMSISSGGGRKGIFPGWQIANKKYSSMLYTIYIISSNFPHVFRSLFQLVCFYPYLPCQTTITKEKKSSQAVQKWPKNKRRSTETEKTESTHYSLMKTPQDSDWIFYYQAHNFCQNTGVFNMAAFSLPLFSTVSSIKLGKWYMLLCNNKNTLY